MSEKAKISGAAALTAKKQTRDLALPVTALGLSTRATNALLNDGVRSVAELVPRTEADLLGIPNFGRVALAELKKALARRKLRLGMVLPAATPSHAETKLEPTLPTTRASAVNGTVLDGYLTPQQLAVQLGICERTLARWYAGRTGPPRSVVGRKILYKTASVTAWLAKHEKNFEEGGGRGAGRRGRR
jgi:hypothetical protein